MDRNDVYKKCCVNGCNRTSRMGIPFHRIPKSKRLEWIKKLKIETDFPRSYFEKRICDHHYQLVNKHDDHSYAYDGDIEKYKNLQEYVAHLERENSELKAKLVVHKDYQKQQVESIVNNKYLLNFYTGFSDLKSYQTFSKIIIEQGKLYIEKKKLKYKENTWRLQMDTQPFIVLTRLRVGLLVVDLAQRYDISPAKVSKICGFWINVMYAYFKQIPIWATGKLIQENLPECFRARYPSTKIILDTTEIFIETPSDCIVQSSTYSQYKSHNTAKGLIGMAPNGFITFISDLYPGRTSDKQLVIESGLLHKLEPGWGVMADRGFTIEEEVRAAGCDVNIPPFVDNVKQFQFTAQNEEKTRDIANYTQGCPLNKKF